MKNDMIYDEANDTDRFVDRMLRNANITAKSQGSGSPLFRKAMQGASKNLSKAGNGYPDFHVEYPDYPILIEDKLSLSKLEKNSIDSFGNKILADDQDAIQKYAVNGAVYYAKQALINEPNYNCFFAIGVVGTEKQYHIQPYYVDRKEIIKLDELQTFEDLSKSKIDEYYRINILHEESKEQKALRELSATATDLHEKLRTYGKLGADNKSTVVSACLIALKAGLQPQELTGADPKGVQKNSDGWKIYRAVESYVNTKITSNTVASNLLSFFTILQTNVTLNTPKDELGGFTPLREFCSILSSNVISRIGTDNDRDILGDFYTEFVSYGGSDGSDLGIVLTPASTTSLMADLIDIRSTDILIDPTMGTGSFLISGLSNISRDIKSKEVLSDAEKRNEFEEAKRHNLYGIEVDSKLFAIATTNMLLRDAAETVNEHFYQDDMFNAQIKWENGKKANRLLMNPPYSQAKKSESSSECELNFVMRALDFLDNRGVAAVIVPQSTVTSGPKGVKRSEYIELKRQLLKSNRVKAVITMNPQNFYPTSIDTVIMIIEKGIPQENYKTLFVDYRDDGRKLNHHLGMLPDGSAKEKRKRLIDIVVNQYKVDEKIALYHEITPEDEWLHSYFYNSTSVPTEEKFRKSMADYMTYESYMKMMNRSYLFESEDQENSGENENGK